MCAGALSLEITPAETVPETDTGGQVEHTKAFERTVLKELGKLHASLRNKRDSPCASRTEWHKPGGSDCLAKTQGSAKQQCDV